MMTACVCTHCKTFFASSYLVRVPVSEKVDGSIQAPLDHGPATWVVPLVAPHLHEAVGVLRLHQVHSTGGVAVLQRVQTVLEGPCAARTDVQQSSEILYDRNEIPFYHYENAINAR